ncbi:hypothetical protein NC653_001330 [Populus alba x Populus x berolinensis]|uniref:Uncharacterized protein n=1 Tax=Populus alba x Populus x berolinensis TaxID=444605 RepID=A0AAD6WFV3_9ROSI|nr:hypothetical protein NC653_001330 [Populus alba x Populus x berolinensis]
MEELLIPVGQRLFYLQVSLASLFRNKKNKKPANLKALCPIFFVNKRQLSFDCPCSSINCLSRALTSQFRLYLVNFLLLVASLCEFECWIW